MQRMDEMLDMIKISNFLRKEEEKENCRKVCLIATIVLAVLALSVAAAYGIYKFVTRDDDEFDDDEFDDEDFEIYDEDDEEESGETEEE